MKYKRARMEEGIMPIKSLWAGWRSETFQTQYTMWNWSWITWKKKIIWVIDISMKCRKVGMEEGIMPIKSLQVGWSRDTFLAQYPMWNCSWIPWKLKVISETDTTMKCTKARMEEGTMSIKSLRVGWRREILYSNTKIAWSCS